MMILEFPYLRQIYDYDCGAKATQAVLAYYGIDIAENKIIKTVGTTKTGTPVSGIIKTLHRYGLKYQAGQMTVDQVKQEIRRNRPVILLLQAWTKKNNVRWEKNWADGHYVVAIGYDDKRIFFEDPSSVSRTYLTYGELKKRWHDKTPDGKKYINHGIVAYGKKHTFSLKKAIHMK